MRILITGLPGSGKSTLAENMVEHMNNTQHLNADVLRQEANDWDFSPEGRKRQAIRMRERADCHMGPTIADFVAPTQELRDIYDPHYTIFLDTIKEGRFADTNAIYEKPTNANRVNRRWLNKEDTGRLVYTMYREVTAGVMRSLPTIPRRALRARAGDSEEASDRSHLVPSGSLRQEESIQLHGSVESHHREDGTVQRSLHR